MRLFIVRHAEPDYARHTITPAGHREAQALARRMALLRPDRLYTSPLPRALHTAQYTADALGLPLQTEEWTAEFSDCGVEVPPWGKLMLWDVPGEIIRRNPPPPTRDNWHTREYFDNPLFRERYARMTRDSDEFIARHGYERSGSVYRCVRANRQKIVVFCHGGFGLWWLAHLLEIPLPLMFAGFFLPPSSVTTVLFDERSKETAVPRCIGLGDVSHLYEAGLPMSTSGIKANID